MDLWRSCGETELIRAVKGELTRIVESQEQIATSSLVDDLAEQHLLEQLLEDTKPPLPRGTEGLHYLLATPFRYPPLRHGSRFGGRHEPGILYGSLQLETALAETAYYRLLFWYGMALPPPSGRLLTQHTAFQTSYASARGVRLHQPPCSTHEALLASPRDYGATQALGQALRGAAVEVVEYRSARARRLGVNVGLFSPAALASPRPRGMQQWLCQTRAESVTFGSAPPARMLHFPREDFLVDGVLPAPAV